MEKKLIKAALLHFQAKAAEHETNLNLYLKNPVAVAEHPDVVANVISLTKSLAEAEECIKVLKTISKEKK